MSKIASTAVGTRVYALGAVSVFQTRRFRMRDACDFESSNSLPIADYLSMCRTTGNRILCILASAVCWTNLGNICVAQTRLPQTNWTEMASNDSPRNKTLLSWNLAEQSEQTEQTEEEDRIVTDRPHFCEASSLVGLGVTQIETGYSYFMNKENGTTTQTHSFPEPLLRAGIFAEWFEFRLGYNYLIQPISDPILGNRRLSGSDDLYVAAKLALAEQAGIFPEVALFPQMRVPSGSPAFTSREVLPGFNLAYSWTFNKWLELECNTQLNRRLDDANHFYTEFIQAVNFEYNFTKRWGGFTEWFCFVPSGSISALPQQYFHGGFVYFPTNNIQLDIHSAVGLTPASDDLALTGVGFSVRF